MNDGNFATAVRAIEGKWSTLRSHFRASSDVVFASGRMVTLLDAERAYEMARLLGVRRPTVERMRANANRFGQWCIAVDDSGKAAAFVIENPQAPRPQLRPLGVQHAVAA